MRRRVRCSCGDGRRVPLHRLQPQLHREDDGRIGLHRPRGTHLRQLAAVGAFAACLLFGFSTSAGAPVPERRRVGRPTARCSTRCRTCSRLSRLQGSSAGPCHPPQTAARTSGSRVGEIRSALSVCVDGGGVRIRRDHSRRCLPHPLSATTFELLHVGFAIPLVVVLAVAALVLSRRARRRTSVSIAGVERNRSRHSGPRPRGHRTLSRGLGARRARRLRPAGVRRLPGVAVEQVDGSTE